MYREIPLSPQLLCVSGVHLRKTLMQTHPDDLRSRRHLCFYSIMHHPPMRPRLGTSLRNTAPEITFGLEPVNYSWFTYGTRDVCGGTLAQCVAVSVGRSASSHQPRLNHHLTFLWQRPPPRPRPSPSVGQTFPFALIAPAERGTTSIIFVSFVRLLSKRTMR